MINRHRWPILTAASEIHAAVVGRDGALSRQEIQEIVDWLDVRVNVYWGSNVMPQTRAYEELVKRIALEAVSLGKRMLDGRS